MKITYRANFLDAYGKVRECVKRYHDTGVDGLCVAETYHDRSNDPLVMPAIRCYKARLQEDPLIERFWHRQERFFGIVRNASICK